jgi:hypothetical protein
MHAGQDFFTCGIEPRPVACSEANQQLFWAVTRNCLFDFRGMTLNPLVFSIVDSQLMLWVWFVMYRFFNCLNSSVVFFRSDSANGCPSTSFPDLSEPVSFPPVCDQLLGLYLIGLYLVIISHQQYAPTDSNGFLSLFLDDMETLDAVTLLFSTTIVLILIFRRFLQRLLTV